MSEFRDIADVPPAFTCPACSQPFGSLTVRRTIDGYEHVTCPSVRTRQCLVEGCLSHQSALGYCHVHYGRWRTHGDPMHGEWGRIHIEDVEWMAATGETWDGALVRLGRDGETLRRALWRADRNDLGERLRANQRSVA